MNIDMSNLPEHIGIIMDGNRRWAKKNGFSKIKGHREGANTLKILVENASKLGIKYLTVYAFSTENWKREENEVNEIMNLLREFLIECERKYTKEDYVVGFIGDSSALTQDIQDRMRRVSEKTKDKKGLHLYIAINYGGRDEIIRAVRKMVESGTKELEITEKRLSEYLDTSGVPDPELIIRTSGEMRISNFLTWQSVYSEFYFSDKYWPDFSIDDFKLAILDFQNRNRRFGGI
ncbi:MAG TPA: isoprenyl transferase [Clostridiales bacterium]|nr:MAG: di-trans,poly-cis-decaprenylcistransferase [Clostridiales bacterium GWD2_32_19]HCC08281.1 isoprenyl transferase [Clostridiales bacterium]